jgi:glycoside/pentoside/hexuronide:cation symporter, GPH family
MISMRRKIAYGMGDMGISLAYFTVGFYFLFYLTDIVGLPAITAGVAYFIGKLWDSINDPFIGVISDRTVSRFGRKRVYLLLGALPFGVSFALLWLIPLDASVTVKFLWATGALLLYTTVYSLITVPYMALVPVMTHDYDERTQITGIRAMLSTLGTLLGGGVAKLVADVSSKLAGLQIMAGTFGLAAGASILVAAQSVKGLEETSQLEEKKLRYSLRDYLKVMRDHNVLILMIFKFLGAVATGSLTAALPYFARHILGSEGISTIGLALYILISAACIPIWNRLARNRDKRRLLLYGTGTAALIMAAIGLLLSAAQAVLFYAGCALLGVALSSYLLIPYSLVPDLVDYYEHKTGERHEAIFFGLWITVHQLGISLAGLLLGILLEVSGYHGAEASQSATALAAVRTSLGLLPGVFLLLAVIVLQGYGISRGRFTQIQLELEQRKTAPAGS